MAGAATDNCAMNGIVMHADGTTTPANADDVRGRCGQTEFFWLDLDGLDDESGDVLRQGFGFHPLAVEDAVNFGQRPKLEDYDDFTYLVVYGAKDAGTPVEVHVFYSEGRLVTVHRGDNALLDDARTRFTRHRADTLSPPGISVLYLVVDSLIDSFFPVLAQFDDRIDEIEDSILREPTEEQLGELFDMKRMLVGLRKVVTPERDLFTKLMAGGSTLPGMTDEDGRYFRDLYDHLIRISDLVDSYRDLLAGAMDTHVSVVSNRLNVVMKQLTIIATVFLPLSFLTGFFGQNFGLLVNHYLAHDWTFWVFGIGLEVGAVVGLMSLFRRRGWLGGPTA
ncbi:MAG TPA: magnesium transporter CorA family protein [Acidimicrobiales bacterium]|nr:magnesium transporter CorA family protein [Acidimicrobiales bacterium]